MTRLIYSGDVNIEHGGVFYSMQTWQSDYVNAVRVQPCSDADGPDNCYWVERLTVNIRKPGNPDRQRALDCIGMDAEQFKKLKPAAKRHALFEAHLAYGFYDLEFSEMVCIGKAVGQGPLVVGHGEYRVNVQLRGNASLQRYARAQAHQHCD